MSHDVFSTLNSFQVHTEDTCNVFSERVCFHLLNDYCFKSAFHSGRRTWYQDLHRKNNLRIQWWILLCRSWTRAFLPPVSLQVTCNVALGYVHVILQKSITLNFLVTIFVICSQTFFPPVRLSWNRFALQGEPGGKQFQTKSKTSTGRAQAGHRVGIRIPANGPLSHTFSFASSR